jgi:hypothetical protein
VSLYLDRLSSPIASEYFRLACQYICCVTCPTRYVSIEENGYGIHQRFESNCTWPMPVQLPSIRLSLVSTLKQLILPFRSVVRTDLTLEKRDDTEKKLPIEILALPCLPSTSHSIDILDLERLQVLDIGYIDLCHRSTVERLTHIVRLGRLRNLTIDFDRCVSMTLMIVSNSTLDEQRTSTNEQFDSIFSDCFDSMATSDDEHELPSNTAITSVVRVRIMLFIHRTSHSFS